VCSLLLVCSHLLSIVIIITALLLPIKSVSLRFVHVIAAMRMRKVALINRENHQFHRGREKESNKRDGLPLYPSSISQFSSLL